MLKKRVNDNKNPPSDESLKSYKKIYSQVKFILPYASDFNFKSIGAKLQ